jgi:hypothetical protein
MRECSRPLPQAMPILRLRAFYHTASHVFTHYFKANPPVFNPSYDGVLSSWEDVDGKHFGKRIEMGFLRPQESILDRNGLPLIDLGKAGFMPVWRTVGGKVWPAVGFGKDEPVEVNKEDLKTSFRTLLFDYYCNNCVIFGTGNDQCVTLRMENPSNRHTAVCFPPSLISGSFPPYLISGSFPPYLISGSIGRAQARKFALE